MLQFEMVENLGAGNIGKLRITSGAGGSGARTASSGLDQLVQTKVLTEH